MRPFSPKVLRVGEGEVRVLAPVPFTGRMDELTLEAHIARDPELAGEPLLVLGRQLAEFEEDKDRLDVLAIDTAGEIVLVELKVTEDFRVTDLQALAYAGAYATRTTDELAQTLRRHLEKTLNEDTGSATEPGGDIANPPGQVASDSDPTDVEVGHNDHPTDITADDAKARIVDFLQVDDFESWQPSQHVRIKLIAPRFPQRVLKTVKWLGDVYDMPIEAIAVRVFDIGPQHFHLAFERLLPLPGDEEFDLTVRRREERKRDDNAARRKNPAVVPLLLKAGKLQHGQRLFVHRGVLPAANRDLFDPDDVAFQVTVHAGNGTPAKFAWRPNSDAEPSEISPSAIPYEVYKAVLPDWDGDPFGTAVAISFTIEPNGKTLADIALDEGLWSPTTAAG